VSNSHEAVPALGRRYEIGDVAAFGAIKDEATKYDFYHNIEIASRLEDPWPGLDGRKIHRSSVRGP
jgi:hypothetical protein